MRKSVSTIKRGSVAFLLSLLAPGLGQIYDGQLLAGILLAVAFVIFISAAGPLGLFHTFRSAVACAMGSLIYQLGTAVYAAVIAIRQVETKSVTPRTSRVYALGTLLVCTVLLAESTLATPLAGVRAYKVPSESMSPTLVAGDRFIVDVKYYQNRQPQRGDVIMFRIPATGMLVIKRVIALAGDTIQVGPEGTFVNGHVLSEPYLRHATDQMPIDANQEFSPVEIPSDKLFVMGDNREESYDSRHFGAIDVSSVAGKALYIYYSSSGNGRIGQAIQ